MPAACRRVRVGRRRGVGGRLGWKGGDDRAGKGEGGRGKLVEVGIGQRTGEGRGKGWEAEERRAWAGRGGVAHECAHSCGGRSHRKGATTCSHWDRGDGCSPERAPPLLSSAPHPHTPPKPGAFTVAPTGLRGLS
eukprot:280225-Chlamydomonas_euryale.AAC.3